MGAEVRTPPRRAGIGAVTDGLLELRPLDLADAAAHLAGEDADSTRWLADPAPSVASVREWILHNRVQLMTDGPVCNLGVRELATGALVGNVESNAEEPSISPDEVNISYGIFPAWRGRGYAVRAINLLLGRLARSHGSIPDAVIRVDPSNVRSIAVAERAGFVRDGWCRGGDGALLHRYLRRGFPGGRTADRVFYNGSHNRTTLGIHASHEAG